MCYTRQKILGNNTADKQNFAEYQNAGMSANAIPSISSKYSVQKSWSRPSVGKWTSILCRVSPLTLGNSGEPDSCMWRLCSTRHIALPSVRCGMPAKQTNKKATTTITPPFKVLSYWYHAKFWSITTTIPPANISYSCPACGLALDRWNLHKWIKLWLIDLI